MRLHIPMFSLVALCASSADAIEFKFGWQVQFQQDLSSSNGFGVGYVSELSPAIPREGLSYVCVSEGYSTFIFRPTGTASDVLVNFQGENTALTSSSSLALSHCMTGGSP